MVTIGPNTLVLGNKADLPILTQAFPSDWPVSEELRKGEWILISALNGEGIDALKRALVQAAGVQAQGDQSQAYLNNARHREALQGAASAFTRAASALAGAVAVECVAADLREVLSHLEALVGEVTQEDILDKVFSEFCLGK
jgi:tRNA modification GTPase